MSELRVGVFGLRRGRLGPAMRAAGASIVAVADSIAERRERAAAMLGAVSVYASFDDLLGHDLDAIVLANHFDEHAPYAVAALGAGRSVLSETAACRTPAEAVALHRAVAGSRAQYMLGENYPFLPHAKTLRSLYETGVLGEVEYVEAEYLHSLVPSETPHVWAGDAPTHWRGRVVYGVLHPFGRAAVVHHRPPAGLRHRAAGARRGRRQSDAARACRARYPAALLAVTLDNGAVLRSVHGFLQGEQISWVRVHGSRGLAESRRGYEDGSVRLRLEPWAAASGAVEVSVIAPPFPTNGDPLAAADIEMCREFVAAVTEGRRPLIDVALGVDATLVGIYGLRSLLAGSVPVAIPDLRDESARLAAESDDTDGLAVSP